MKSKSSELGGGSLYSRSCLSISSSEGDVLKVRLDFHYTIFCWTLLTNCIAFSSAKFHV